MLAQWPKKQLVILVTRQGKPFTPAGFGGRMAERSRWLGYLIIA
jgi:hypothetical protein